MSLVQWMVARRRGIASGAAVGTAAAGVLLAIVTAEGYPAADVRMNDAGVWVTSQQLLKLGRFNRQVDQLDADLAAGSGRDFDVVQDGSTVLLLDRNAARMSAVDPATLNPGPLVAVPAGAALSAGGGRSALLDPGQGKVWVREGNGAGLVDARKDKDGLDVGAGSAMVVGADGTVAVASARERRLTVVPAAGGGAERSGLDVDAAADVSVTLVGTTPVVLDRTRKRLVLPSGTLDVSTLGGRPVLQQPGPAASAVLLATDTALLSIPLNDGDPTPIGEGSGAPTAPVRLGSCAHAAWSSRPMYLLSCDGGAPKVQTVPVPAGQAAADLRLRVNRGQIVLNDVASGAVWLLTDPLKQVANWDDLQRQERKDEKKTTKEEDEEQSKPREQVRKGRNHPPVARPDALGARPGGSVIVPVIDNDSDVDGDVLALDGVPRLDASSGRLDLVSNGQALQFTPGAGVSGDVRFRYRITDGRGGSAEAQVTVSIRPDSQNTPPRPKPGARANVTVELGKTAQHGVLADWEDPDGDPLVLTSASVDTRDTIRWTAAGLVTYIDAGIDPGKKKIALTVSDGRAEVPGVLTVTVRPTGNLPPDVRDDLFVARAGQAATLRPLLNDTDANGDDLRLVSVKAPAGVTVVPDLDRGTLALTAGRPGTVLLDYEASDGPQTRGAQIRVDVRDLAGNTPPVAVADSLTVPEAGSGLVDVVANDLDLDGDVLAVRSVTVPPNSGIRVSVLDLHVLQIEDDRALLAPVTVGYEVSDGAATARGTVTVRTSHGSAVNQPPLVRDDHPVVRAGDILTIPVLRNDTDPDGDRLALAPTVTDVGKKGGLLFVDGDVLRFQAPPTPTTVSAIYTAVDSRGARASGQVTISVRGADPARNQPPSPATVEARVFMGSTVHVKIPLHGIDPDGDSVTLLGVASAPRLGTVGPVKDGDTLVYQAFDVNGAGGTDTFGYLVEDSLGTRATATVRIGVVPRPALNQAPVATDDLLRIRPGTQVAVPVLANDTDPDGDTIGLDPTTPFTAPQGLAVTVLDERLAFTAPSQAGAYTIAYAVTDGRGGRDSGFLTVQVDPQAPLQPPVARDDVVPTTADARQEAGRTVVSVDVLANDDDPDGMREDLKVALVGPNAGAGSVDGAKVTVGLNERPQAVAYRVTDVSGLTATAFVRVPGLVDQPPRLRPDALVTVKSGTKATIPLQSYVVDPEGRTVRLTSQSKVSATGADGGADLVVNDRTLAFTPAAGYVGPGGITFEVTDGSGPDDPKGNTAVLTLPVQVLAPDNTPPVFQPTTIDVAPGESALSVGLREFVRDRDTQDTGKHTFSRLTGVPSGFSASIDGATLRVSADASTPKGTVARMQVLVSDGHHPGVPGTIVVRVTASTRPLARANDDTVEDADQGKPVTIDVLANDANPFPETPLKVGAARVVTGSGAVEVRGGNDIVFTPAADFVGTARLTYTVIDATNDPAREVTGRVAVAVRGVPSAPVAPPTVVDSGDEFVALRLTAPVDNGAAVTRYDIDTGSGTATCATDVCQVEGLRNGTEYRFRFRGVNEVGEGPWSDWSTPATPDVVPETPDAPTATFVPGGTGGRLQVDWTEPTNRGTPIRDYLLEMSPAGPNGSQIAVTGTTTTLTGLTNGTSYVFRIAARNSRGASPTSAPSAPETPAGVPGTPAAPSAVNTGGALGGRVRVSWYAPAGNGAAVTSYSLRVIRAGSVQRTISTTATSMELSADNATDYQFSVSATNRSGTSSFSPTSATLRVFRAPDAPSGLRASPGDGSATLSFNAPDDGGQTIQRYEYRVGSGSWRELSSNRVVYGLSNGDTVSIALRACNDYCGDASSAATVNPYGPMGAPDVSTGNPAGHTVTFSWGSPRTNGRAAARTEYSINGGGWQTASAAGGSWQSPVKYNTSYSIRVRGIDVEGGAGADAGASNATQTSFIEVYRGGKVNISGVCWTSPCGYVVVQLYNFDPGAHSCQLSASGNDNFTPGKTGGLTITADSSGRGTGPNKWVFGYPGRQVWATCDGFTSPAYTWPS